MIKSIIKFARLRIVATCYALVFLGSTAAGGMNIKTILALIPLLAITIHANSINDYADQDIDKINFKNASDRPLVTRDITLKEFWIIHYFSGVIALLLSFFYGKPVVLLTLVVLAANYLYSLKPARLAYRPVVSPLLLSAAYVYYSFSLGYFSIDMQRKYPWLLTIGLFLGFIARMLLKDFRDAKGDKQHGKLTFLLRYGRRITCAASGIFWLLAVLGIIKASSYAVGVTIPLVLGALGVSYMLVALSSSPRINDQQKIIAYIAKSANFSLIALLAYLLCRNQTTLSSSELKLIPAVIGVALLIVNFIGYANRKPAA
jgi:4-hydroxybenzoate polyprenyltransferase